jgi:hypothetical protein
MSIDADMLTFGADTLVYCPECHGEGEVERTVNMGECWPVDVPVECACCRGAGAVRWAEYDGPLENVERYRPPRADKLTP